MSVVVEKLSANAEQAGLSSYMIQTDVELRLRQSSVRIEKTSNAVLYINVNVLKSGDRFVLLL